MKTRILLICLLLSGVYEAMACGKVTVVEVNQPYGRISCKAGSGYELNHEIAWLINIGKNKKVRIKYYKDTPDGKDPLSFYNAPDAASLRACINNPNYFITNASHGFARGTVTTDTASGCCVVLFQINNGGNSNYPDLPTNIETLKKLFNDYGINVKISSLDPKKTLEVANKLADLMEGESIIQYEYFIGRVESRKVGHAVLFKRIRIYDNGTIRINLMNPLPEGIKSISDFRNVYQFLDLH